MVDRFKMIVLLSLIFLFSPLILVAVAVWLIWFYFWGVVLRLWFWRTHCVCGRDVLFVYSESPNWQEYIERKILPKLDDRAVILNWSRRRLWFDERPWEARFFHRFSGHRDFNPIALVFSNRGRVIPVRFHQAFMDAKHGHDSELRQAETQLFELLESKSSNGCRR